MSYVTSNQPTGTPTWIELDVHDTRRAAEFYGALFGWEFEAGAAEAGRYTLCLLRGRPVAGLRSAAEPTVEKGGSGRWRVYIATDDCDDTAKRVVAAGGTLVEGPQDVGGQGRAALVVDPVGAEFGLWQGRGRLGCEIVNEPGSLVRNDLTTPDPGPARAFYPAVFDYTLDGNDDLPDADFSFLRRPDGHEIGGIMGVELGEPSVWKTLFEVADTDAAVARAVAAGGTAGAPSDTIYARMAEITDPFGNSFEVGARPR
ncbi:VOC family protein [Streptomyces sp. NBC_00872]|uniref:VOC family protein n=1 Tax=Streptomyces sp. NBC_00872 TaxID=2903686 RepID=UPI0038674BFD|nr:VOC family protein [Streptomyces sp. NBC_00872]